MESLPDLRLKTLESAVENNEVLQELGKIIEVGFPQSSNDLSPSIQPYWFVREHLSVDGKLVLKGQRLVIPKSLRRQVLEDLHASHQGQERTKNRARQVLFWPNMNKDVDNIVKQCPQCRLFQASQPKETLMSEPVPELSFQSVNADLF